MEQERSGDQATIIAEPRTLVVLPAAPLAPTVSRGAVLRASSVVSLALGAGAFLRFWHINSLGFNSDEAVYAGQAAALAGDPSLSKFFPIVRAHPMVFQYLMALCFEVAGYHDLIARTFSAIIGLLTIYLVYRVGATLYGQWTGVAAALLMALMPYHVIVTRQVLLDGPMTFCTTLALYLIARFAATHRPSYLYGAGSALGLVFLTKETGFVLVAAAFAFLALSPQIKLRIRDIIITGICMMIPIFMFPVSVVLAGRSDTAKSYLIWQLLRKSNHSWTFFPTVVPPAIGWFVIAAAAAGFFLLRGQRTWRETLLLSWVAVPVVIFQLWPVKGFQYLLPIAPVVALLAARTLTLWRPRGRFWPWGNTIAVGLVALTLLIPSWSAVSSQASTTRIAGQGGIPGVRQMGAWIQANAPEDSVFVAIGPSMANLIQFYGHRKAYGLSVSANPLHRNPSYEPLTSPDARFRYGDVQYIVYDSFTAARTPHFTQALMSYAQKYHAREVYAGYLPVKGTDGRVQNQKIIAIYEVTG
jgi:4-amino-4-deoxy-L-arabinose transferase-like glycosyltransferase